MEYKDTRQKFITAWQQEIVDEMAKRGIQLSLPSNPEYFYGMSGGFQGAKILLWLSSRLNTLKVSWGPIYIPKSNASGVSYVYAGSKSYDTLIKTLTRKIKKLGANVFIGQEAIEAMLVNNAAGKTGSVHWHCDRLADRVNATAAGETACLGEISLIVSQELKDVMEKKDTPLASTFKNKYL